MKGDDCISLMAPDATPDTAVHRSAEDQLSDESVREGSSVITIAASSARRRVHRERIHEATSIAITCQPYFRRIARTVGRAAAPVSTAAVPNHVGALGATVPRRSQGRRVTSGKLLIRFTLPAVTSVVNPTVPSPRSTIQTAVSTIVPLRRRVATETYRCEPTISGEVTTGNY